MLNTLAPVPRTAIGSIKGFSIHLGHQFYMDDLKLYSRTKEDLEKQLSLVRKISEGIGLQLNTTKCAQMHFTPRDQSTNIESMGGLTELLPSVTEDNPYKYLGVKQTLRQHPTTFDKAITNFKERTVLLLRSGLTWRQIRQAYLSLAVSKLSYLFLVASQALPKFNEITTMAKNIDNEVRDLLRAEKVRFKAQSVSRLYLSSARGGCGWPSVELELKKQVILAWSYVVRHPHMSNVFRFFQATSRSNKRSIYKDGWTILKETGIDITVNDNEVILENMSYRNYKDLAHAIQTKLVQCHEEKLFANWSVSPLAGRVCRLDEIDHEASWWWMEKGLLAPDNLRNALAVQEGCIRVRAAPMMRGEQCDKSCRVCGHELETVEHVVSHCPHWLTSLYISRHDNVARCIMYMLCEKYGIAPYHYSVQIPPVSTINNTKILWGMPVQTKEPMVHRKPDIVLYDGERKVVIVVEVSVPFVTGIRHQIELKTNRYTVNSLRQEDDNDLPYRPGPNLCSDLHDTTGWEVRFIPVVIGASGEVPVGLYNTLQKTFDIGPNKARDMVERMSREAALGTSRIIKNHLSR